MAFATTTHTITFGTDNVNSSSAAYSFDNGIVFPVAVVCPSALDGTLFRIQVLVGGTWRSVRTTSGTDYLITFSANGFVPLETEIIKALKGKTLRIVTGTAQTANRTFIIVYDKL
jgi:hypothetical protein